MFSKNLALFSLLTGAVFSTDINFSQNGTWSDGASWQGGVEPASSDRAVFPASASWNATISSNGGTAGSVSVLGTSTWTSVNGSIFYDLNFYPSSDVVLDVRAPLGIINTRVNLQNSGTISLGSTLNLQRAIIRGSTNSNSLTILGTGALVLNNSSYIQDDDRSSYARSFSTLEIQSGSITNAGLIGNLGGTFSGTVSITGGSISNSGYGQIAFLNGSATGVVNLTHGTMQIDGLTVSGSLYGGIASLFGSAQGSITIQGGSYTNNANFATIAGSAIGAVSFAGDSFITNNTLLSCLQDQAHGSISLSNGQINNGSTGYLVSSKDNAIGTVTITGGSFTNRGVMASLSGSAQGLITIDGGTITNLGYFGQFQDKAFGTISVLKGDIINSGQFATVLGSGVANLDISGGSFSHSGYLASWMTGSFSISGSSSITANNSSKIGPCPLLMSGGLVSNRGIITLDRVTISGTLTRSVANSAITGGTLTGPGNLWIAGNATITAPIQQSNVFIGWGGTFSGANYYYSGSTVNGTLFSHGTSIDANIQVTGSGAWFVLDGTIAKGTITNNGSITRGVGVGFFGLGTVSVTNNNSVAEGVGTVYFSGASLTNTKNFATGATIVEISSGQIVNTPTGRVAQNLKGTLTISGGSIINSGRFGYQDGSNKAVIDITGGTIINGTSTSDFNAYFGYSADAVSISGQAQIVNNKNFGMYARNLLITGGSTTNNFILGYLATNISIASGEIRNDGQLANSSGTLTILGGSIKNNNNRSISTFGGNVTISGGTLTQTGGDLAPFITNALTIQGTANIISDAGSSIGPAQLLMTGGSVTNSGFITLDKVTVIGAAFTRSVANSAITGGTLTGPGNLWIAGNATITAPIQQGTVFVGWGGEIIIAGYSPIGTTVSGTLFSHGTSIDANIQVTGSGAWFVLEGTIAKGTITNHGSITKGAGLSFFGLKDVSVTNNSSIAESVGTVYFSGASLTNTKNFANGATIVEISSGQILNTPTGGVAQNFKGTLSISGGSITNRGYFGYQNSSSNNAVIDITGGTIVNGTGTGDSAIFGNAVGTFTIINPAQIINNSILGQGSNNLSIFGGSIQNYKYIGSGAKNLSIYSGEIRNTGQFGPSSRSLSISGGSITNWGSLASEAGSVTISGGTLTQTGFGRLAPFITNSLAIQGTAHIINDIGSRIGPASLLMNGAIVVNNGLITLDKVFSASGSYSRTTADSNISAGTLSGTGSLWIAGNASITTGVQQSHVFIGCGGSFTGGKYDPVVNNVNGTLFSNGTSIDANIQVTGSGAWFVLDGTIAKGTITNDGSITKGVGVGFFGLKDVSVTNNSSIAESVGTVYFSGASLTNTKNFATGATAISISNGQIVNTGSVAQYFKGTLSITGGSITNSGFFGNHDSSSNSAVIEITGGTIVNGASATDFGAFFGEFAHTVKITNQAQVYNNNTFARYVQNLSISGGSIQTNLFLGLSATNFNISAGEIRNTGQFGPSSRSLNISGGSITNWGSLASEAGSVTISGGTLTQTGFGRLAPYITNSLAIQGTAHIINNNSSYIGPAPLLMTGGAVINSGIITLDKMYLSGRSLSRFLANSFISGGSLTGTGSLWIAGSCSITTPITQGAILVGCGGSIFNNNYTEQPTPVTGTLSSSTTLTGRMQILGSGTFLASGTVIGSVTVDPFGHLSPGGLSDPVDALNISGHLVFGSNGNLDIDFDETGNDFITIYGGSLALPISPKANLNLRATGPVPTNTFFDVIKIINPIENKLSSINLTPFGGEFNVVTLSPYLLAPQLFYSSTGITMVAGYNSIESAATTSNQKAVARVLDELNGNTTICLQEKIDELLYATTIGPITEALDTLDPAELKGQQLVIEEMSFIMNNELSHLLYCHHKGYRPFVSGGYEKLSQDSYSQYNGFSTNAGYELAGLSYGFDKWQLLGALGAEQTSTSYRKTPARSSSSSVIANLGASGFMKGWSFGLDALFGYHFIHTSRTLLPFGLKALSNHGAYNLKFEAKGAYTKVWANTRFIPYEQFGYNFTHENSFKEHGASCLDLSVRSSSRSMLRNTLGLRIETRVKRSVKRPLHIQPYVDGSWVWENRFSGLGYRASFVDTAPSMSVRGINMTRNFGKLELGLLGSGEKWSGKLNFNGMWGSRFYEMGASFTLDRRF